MKTKNLFFLACLSLCTIYSCSNDNEPVSGSKNDKYVKFTGAIAPPSGVIMTKASTTTWTKGDAIGVYMRIGENNQAENVKHITTGDGLFSAETTGIELPADGSNVNFIAYYPYQSAISNLMYPINVADQTSLPSIDLLYSNNAQNINKDNASVNLNFKHMLSLLVLNIKVGDGVSSLSGLSLSINGVTTDGTFNLANSTITLGSTKGIVNPSVATNETTATVNAILLPGQDLSQSKLAFSLNGKIYEWTPSSKSFESGKKYSYSVQLSATGVVVLNPTATIEDWTEGNIGGSSIVLVPNENDTFTADKTALSLEAAAASSTINLTTENSQAWTAAVDANATEWLTVSTTNGTGSAALTLSAAENTATEPRTATVTITASNNSELLPIVITITQKGKNSTAQNLLFAGSDFEDWAAFVAGLNSYGLKDYATQSSGNGRSGSAAMLISGTPTANDYVFTAKVPTAGLSSTPSKVIFYIKGTAAKSLSLNVYLKDGKFKSFNLGECSADMTLDVTASNSYAGTINTASQWVKVVLNLTGLDVATAADANIFALKVGKEAAYNLFIDDITFE